MFIVHFIEHSDIFDVLESPNLLGDCDISQVLGRLGVKDKRFFNKALLGKWLWRFRAEEEDFEEG